MVTLRNQSSACANRECTGLLPNKPLHATARNGPRMNAMAFGVRGMKAAASTLLIMLLVTTPAVAIEAHRPVPLSAESQAAISGVADVAKKHDLQALRRRMVKAFTWSFGGDRDADQALEEWAKDPRYCRELQRVLRTGCHLADTDHIECHGRGGLTFRAGFVRVGSAWMLEYFVEGD